MYEQRLRWRCDLLSNDDQRSRADQDGKAGIKLRAEEWEHQTEEATDDVRRDGVELLADNSVVRVDSANNGGCKECETLNCNVVEQEDRGSAESDR